MRFLFWRRQRRESELDEEIQAHLEMAARDRIERGEPPARAAEAARKEFGNAVLVREAAQEMWGGGAFDRFMQDVRFGMRMLARTPGFTAIAILTLALGIGANTALFSVVNGVLLAPLPFPEPERLVMLSEKTKNFEHSSIPYPNFLDWQRGNHTFSAMATFTSDDFTVTGRGETERVRGERISADLFPLLGVKPVIGRTILPEEDRPGGRPAAMISAGLWKRKFGGSADAPGKTIVLDGRDHTIVGVVPAGFHLLLPDFPEGNEVYVPIGQWDDVLLLNRKIQLGAFGVGRLKPDVTPEQAQADMSGIAANLAAAYPEADKEIGARIEPLKEWMVHDVRPYLLVLLAAVGFVLLIACVNVANLLLARSTARAREFAIRAALGASRGRIVRQLLTESAMLGLAGGALGLLVAAWGTQGVLGMMPEDMPRAEAIGLNTHVLFFTAVVSLLAGIFFGLAPALKIARPDWQHALKGGGRGLSGARSRAQGALVAAEMAMALVLLIGAGLMIRSIASLWSVHPGFEARNVLTFAVSLAPRMNAAPPEAIRENLRQVRERIAAIPGVEAVSMERGGFPMEGDSEDPFSIEGRPKPPTQSEMPWALWYEVEPDYLKAMGIPLLRGRFFTGEDTSGSRGVVVIDEAFARQYFPNEDPIGEVVDEEYIGRQTIIGVVGHVKQWGLDDDNILHAEFYFPFTQIQDRFISRAARTTMVIARTHGRPEAYAEAIRRAVVAMNKEQGAYAFKTMEEIVSRSLGERRFAMILLGSFAGLALLLASVGIYGVVSYLASQRTREIGIRMALGAQRRDVLRLVLGEGVKMALFGVGIGLAAAAGLTRLMTHVLYGVSATDPLTFAGVTLLLAAVALAASWLPARRAMRVDPIVALHYE
ncbi:MAG TPA: ABC transporter permease [Candidatus Sulfotelmatobacter sp.]|nr:ABC transporter permease [Candidatus Sulfotelmatobacter sp.]